MALTLGHLVAPAPDGDIWLLRIGHGVTGLDFLIGVC